VIWSENQACDVRHDQAGKADEAPERYGNSGQQRSNQNDADTRVFDLDSELVSVLIA
jgi:hypothetical protein